MAPVTLVFLVVLATACPGSGKFIHPGTLSSEDRIVGGANARAGQFPYQVSLRQTSNNFHFCGGSIINNRWIVTAAHCVDGNTPNNVHVAVGTIYTSQGTIHKSSRLICHPGYNLTTLTNDIGLVQTSTTITFTNLVQPIALGSSTVRGGVTAVVSGWGYTYTGGGLPATLQHLTINTITNTECKNLLYGNAGFVYDNVLCTYLTGGKGICNGDSGGPLVANNQLLGAASWVIPCARGYPDVFTRISSHRYWIINTAK